jgi:hypothetical protein
MRLLRTLTFRRSTKQDGGIERALRRMDALETTLSGLAPIEPTPSLPPAARALPAGRNGSDNGRPNGQEPPELVAGPHLAADPFILDEEWKDLFTPEERDAARRRMNAGRRSQG